MKSTDNENIVINCLVKDTFVKLYMGKILCMQKKFKHLKNLKLADSNSNNESSCVDILIGSDFLWDIFESQIIRREPAMPIAMKTKFGYVLSGPMSKVQNNEGSYLICHSLKCPTENSENILQKKTRRFLGD